MEKAVFKPVLTYASPGVVWIVGEQGDLQHAIRAELTRRQIHKTPADKYAGAPMDTGIIERCSLNHSADVARRAVRPLLLHPDARDSQ